MINWKVRFKNWIFVVQILAAFVLPILAYYGLTAQDLTTWGSVFTLIVNALSNPYVLGISLFSVWNAVNDPLTKGFRDSKLGMTYDEPKDDSKKHYKLP